MAGKTNTFSFVYFTESITDAEMFSRLESMHFQAAVSPLHDADVWTREDVMKRIYRKADQVAIETNSNRGCFYLLPGSGDSDILRPRDLEHLARLPCYLYWAKYSRDKRGLPDEERWNFWRCPVVGERKKPHRHVIIRLDYSTSWDTLANKLEFSASKISYIEPVMSRDALVRYLCHLDSEDKALYPRGGVVTFGGFNVDALYKSDEVTKDGEFAFIYDVVRSTPTITSTKALCDALQLMNEDHLARVAFGQSGHWERVIRATREQRRDIEGRVMDPQTGEVLC